MWYDRYLFFVLPYQAIRQGWNLALELGMVALGWFKWHERILLTRKYGPITRHFTLNHLLNLPIELCPALACLCPSVCVSIRVCAVRVGAFREGHSPACQTCGYGEDREADSTLSTHTFLCQRGRAGGGGGGARVLPAHYWTKKHSVGRD